MAASYLRRFAPVVLALLLVPRQTSGFPSGAGQCLVGKASVSSTHLPATKGDGTLSFFGLEVRIDGALISPANSFTITGGASHTIEIKATNEEFKGFLIAASSTSGADLEDALKPDAGTGQISNICPSLVGGITHKDNGPKTTATGTLLVDAGTVLTIDVTVVLQNSGGVSAFGWAQYRGAATNPAAPVVPPPTPVRTPPTQAPAKRPTLKPASPTMAPKRPTPPPQRPPADPRAPTAPPARPPSNRGDGGVVRGGWKGCLAEVQRKCPCRNMARKCAGRVIGRRCRQAILARRDGRTGFVKKFTRKVRRSFRKACRRMVGNSGDGYYRFEDGWW